MSSRRNDPSRIGHGRLAARNRAKQCTVPGCVAHRTALGQLCRRHLAAAERNGHWAGRAIKPDEYQYERSLVEKLFVQHAGHAALVSALKWADTWLESSAAGESVPGRRQIARLADAAVKPMQMIVAACSLYLYSRFNAAKLPDDLRVDFAMANAVLNLATHEKRRHFTPEGKSRFIYRRPARTERREVGTRIRTHLGEFLLNVSLAVEDELDRKQRDLMALHKPFSTTAGEPPKD